MNVNTNMNNIPVNQVLSKTAANNQQISMDKNDFLKMLKMMMAENQNPSQLAPTEDTMLNPDILLLMAGNNLVNKNIADTSGQAVKCGRESEAEKKPAADKAQADLYGMADMFNPAVNSNIMNLLTAGETIVPGISGGGTTYSMPESADYNPYIGLFNTNQFQNIRQTAGLKMQNVSKEITGDSCQSVGLETQNPSEEQNKTGTAVRNFSSEKLISLIDGNRNRLKNEIDSKANLLMANNKAVAEEQNHIITVSDEASEIRSQILSQITDKIVIMAKKPDSEGSIKYVTMELQPHGLGKVDIKMAFEDNKLKVEIKALNEETQKILQSNVKDLADILNKVSKTLVDIIVKDNNYNRYESHVVSNDHNNQQQEQHNYNRENQDNDEARQQGRNKEGYFYQKENSDKDEKDVFSQMINLNDIKLK